MPSDELLDFVARVAGDEFLKVEEDFGAGFVRLQVAEAERRQAKHDIRSTEDAVLELLRNARDAGARHIWLATIREGDVRTLTVLDDGVGVPDAMLQRIFDARVTSKLTTMRMDDWGVHGRGMALFSIAANADSARVAWSRVATEVAGDTGGATLPSSYGSPTAAATGTAITVTFHADRLNERADQSTWPAVKRVGAANGAAAAGSTAGAPDSRNAIRPGDYVVESGPHNIVRCCTEFWCAHPDLEIYVGSPTEVAAAYFRDAGAAADVPADAADLADAANERGLALSERGAYRILRGEVTPAKPVRARVLAATRVSAGGTVDIYRDRRGLSIAADDLDDFRRSVEAAFDTLADKYYLSAADAPQVKLARNKLRITIDFDKDE
ncbi:MAG: ATP-binding protein [Actinomycetes bacterium]|jgi:hypothetical protein|nr:ATP-binding protein [Actinomycetes bacterium]